MRAPEYHSGVQPRFYSDQTSVSDSPVSILIIEITSGFGPTAGHLSLFVVLKTDQLPNRLTIWCHQGDTAILCLDSDQALVTEYEPASVPLIFEKNSVAAKSEDPDRCRAKPCEIFLVDIRTENRREKTQ